VNDTSTSDAHAARSKIVAEIGRAISKAMRRQPRRSLKIHNFVDQNSPAANRLKCAQNASPGFVHFVAPNARSENDKTHLSFVAAELAEPR
jgi:hypothetical protein